MNLTHEQLKLLIETAPSAEKADELIEETTRIKNVAEKAAFIRGMFGVKVVGKDDSYDRTDYYVMLETIVKEY